jgi:hypothetical protein
VSTRKSAVRSASFAPPLPLAGWAWHATRNFAGPAGFSVALVVLLLLWPMLVLTVAFGIPAALALLVPRWLRVAWRHSRFGSQRATIPARVRRAVLAADRHCCAYCGDRSSLQLDHVKPWAVGGLASLFNLVTLCASCNKTKSNYWRFRDGYVCYRPWPGHADISQAAAILAAERRHRANPLRWIRAAWALG